jgi:VIT1/CCC1 family predicted Fe2+/Mn2+ transporter
MILRRRFKDQNYFRSMLFGAEDALVSTLGMVVGISAGTSNREFILLASFVTVIVEALSMGAGEYLSEKSVGEFNGKKKKSSSPIVGGLVMFFSYLLAGTIPVVPTVVFTYPQSAVISTISSFIGLFALGVLKGEIVKKSPSRSGFEVMFVGGIAAIAGLIVGLLFRSF